MSNSKRDKYGRFEATKFTSVYRQSQLNNVIMPKSHKVMCIKLEINRIPKGMAVHHINRDSLDNSIDNLALMTVTGHNRTHSHKAWNKGITASSNKKWAETVKKQQASREKTFLLKCKESYDLRMSGMMYKDITKKINLNRQSIFRRIKKYEKHLQQNK